MLVIMSNQCLSRLVLLNFGIFPHETRNHRNKNVKYVVLWFESDPCLGSSVYDIDLVFERASFVRCLLKSLAISF